MDHRQPPSSPDAALIAELRDAIRARDDFIAIASHELRNPMTPILSRVELLRDQARRADVAPEIQASLDRLALAVRRFVRRATTLLDVSRINADHLRLDASPLDLAAVVRQVAADHEAAARYVGSNIDLRLPLEMHGAWDALAVEQVVENLLGNAVRYGRGHPIEVALEDTGDGTVLLTVRDEGPGIAEADLPRLFGRFEQVMQRRDQGGFGIGLWLTHRLVHAMGGSVSVASRVGEGSTFAVRLPRRMAETGKAG